MKRRKAWQKVLAAEVQRWSAMPYSQLVSKLRDLQAYEIEVDSQKYQVEVELLVNAERHLHIMVAVDDGTLPASLSPVCQTFIREKPRK
jgi:hypothetical protein